MTNEENLFSSLDLELLLRMFSGEERNEKRKD
jgi:hypothetical protein